MPPASPPPALDVVARATYGDVLAASVAPGGEWILLGEGASLSILQSESLVGGGARVVARAETAVAAHALALDPPHAFLAAGTDGLWHVEVGDAQAPSDDAGAWSVEERLLESVDAPCVDVARLDGHPEGPMILALLAAHPESGGSELVVLRREPTVEVRARVPLSTEVNDAQAKAYALAVDAGDPRLVHVAMGSAGLLRVDLTDLDDPRVERGPMLPAALPPDVPRNAVDVACVSWSGSSVLFVAADGAGLRQIEIRDPSSYGSHLPVLSVGLGCDAACGSVGVPYARRVSAIRGESGAVLVAVATDDVPAEQAANGPFSCLGRWTYDLLLSSSTAPAGCRPQVHLLRVEAPPTPGASAEPAFVLGSACRPARSRSVDLVTSGDRLLLVETGFDGVRAAELGEESWTAPSVELPTAGHAWAGAGLASTDGVASTIDPGLLYFGADGISVRHAGMPRVDPATGILRVVPETGELCPDAEPWFCNANEPAVVPPSPWRNGLAGGARWTLDGDPGREWFAAGKSRVSAQCAADPCAWSDAWCLDPWREEGDAPLDDLRPPGWEIVRLATGAAEGGGSAMQLEFWSIASPPDAEGRRGRNYFSATASPASAGEQGLLHLFRGAVADGYVVAPLAGTSDVALDLCDVANGRGQGIEPPWTHVLRTHFELGPNDAADFAVTWRGEEFEVEVGGSVRRFVAIAAGWIVPLADAPWAEHAGRALAVVYDVTDVSASNAPRLARLLLGPADEPGNAVAVGCSAEGDRLRVFVGDLGGAAHVFAFDPAELLAGAVEDPALPDTALLASATWRSPREAWDGERANVTDLELAPPVPGGASRVVVANARRGVSVLEVVEAAGRISLEEAAGSPVSTPGIASGLIPIVRDGAAWFAVGDARCGVRVFRLPD